MGKFKFSDETLEHIFSKERTREVPIKYQSIMVHVIEEVLGETGNAYEFQSVGTYEQADISDTRKLLHPVCVMQERAEVE